MPFTIEGDYMMHDLAQKERKEKDEALNLRKEECFLDSAGYIWIREDLLERLHDAKNIIRNFIRKKGIDPRKIKSQKRQRLSQDHQITPKKIHRQNKKDHIK